MKIHVRTEVVALPPRNAARSSLTAFQYLYTVDVRPTRTALFEDYLRRLVESAEQTRAPQSWRSFQVLSGGPATRYFIEIPFDRHAEKDAWIPPAQALARTFGLREGLRIHREVSAAIERAATSEHRYVPVLSARASSRLSRYQLLRRSRVRLDKSVAYERFLEKLALAEEASGGPGAARRVATRGELGGYSTTIPFDLDAELDAWPDAATTLSQHYGHREGRRLLENRARLPRDEGGALPVLSTGAEPSEDRAPGSLRSPHRARRLAPRFPYLTMEIVQPRQIRETIHDLRDELFELARDLVRTPSVTGNEDAAQESLAARLRGWGLEVDLFRIDESVTSHPAFCDDGLPVARLNLVARFGDGVPSDRAALVLNGHIDVVPEGAPEGWRRAPYGGDIADGALHGRGSCDMKGGLAASAIALRAVSKLGLLPRRPIQLWSVVGEETGGLGTLAAIERGYRGDAAVIAEPTSLELCPVQAGALSFRLHVPGKAAHGAMRAEGVSAVEKFTPVLEALRALERRRHDGFRHPAYARGNARGARSASAESRRETGRRPFPRSSSRRAASGSSPARIATRRGEASSTPSRRGLRERRVAPRAPRHRELVRGTVRARRDERRRAHSRRARRRCHGELLGREPVSHGVSYGSDLRLFTRYADMPAVLYGPGDVRVAHAANESVPLDELVHAAEVLTLLVARSL